MAATKRLYWKIDFKTVENTMQVQFLRARYSEVSNKVFKFSVELTLDDFH